MKATRITITTLFTIFLLICIGVHVYGLATGFNNESILSHSIHLISYGLCLYALLRTIPYRFLIYVFAAVYPFLYHAHCAWNSYSLHGKLNGICILVVVMMPLMAVWIWKQSSIKPGA